MKLLFALPLPLLLAACAVGPDYHPATLSPVTLAENGGQGVAPDPLPNRWWQVFEDKALDDLVDKALRHNTDLRIAAANLQKARGALGEARAGLVPEASAQAQYQRLRSRAIVSDRDGNLTARTFSGQLYSPAMDASYELDLLGGVRRGIEAALADHARAAALLDAARVSVAGDTARYYVTACAYGAQAAVARDTLDLQRRTLTLTQAREQGGRGTQRDVAQAKALVAQAEALIPTLEAERRAALYALATLTGERPEALTGPATTCTAIPAPRQPLPVGDGQPLLARRPDLRAAERQLAGDMARIGMAKANLYPKITLLGTVGFNAPSLSNLGAAATTTYSAGPLIRWSLPLNGGPRARLRQARAQADAALAGFDKAVLTALQETEQALARLDGAARREDALNEAAKASEQAASLTQIRFRAGSDNFLQLLDAQRSLASARGQAIAAASDRALAQVSLFKALGGGWQEAPVVERLQVGQ
jgi:NodT family efflux transporter outer membrane factor (OMF) lipoprotein